MTRKFPSLELKQRIVWIAESLEKHLPTHFPDAAKHILRCLPPPLDPNKTDDDFGDFIFAPLGEFVVRNGASLEYLDLSLATLKEITKRFSMEDAVRAFIREFPDETMQTLTGWVHDSNYHVRRLVSESTRPLLPWSGRIDLPPERTIALLNQLHADRTRYVTRSVANHLNDIAKNHPELVVQSLSDWHRQEKQHREELMWMTRHSLRTWSNVGTSVPCDYWASTQNQNWTSDLSNSKSLNFSPVNRSSLRSISPRSEVSSWSLTMRSNLQKPEASDLPSLQGQ